MKREELVARNLRLSAARHSVTPRQKARQAMAALIGQDACRPDHIGRAAAHPPHSSRPFGRRPVDPAGHYGPARGIPGSRAAGPCQSPGDIGVCESAGTGCCADHGFPRHQPQPAAAATGTLATGAAYSQAAARSPLFGSPDPAPGSLVGRAGYLAGRHPAAHWLRTGGNHALPYASHPAAPRARPAAQPASRGCPGRASGE